MKKMLTFAFVGGALAVGGLAVALADRPGASKPPKKEAANQAQEITSKGAPVDSAELLNQSLRERLRDRGTKISPKYGVEEAAREAQQDICNLYNAKPPEPPAARLDHFRHLVDDGYRIVGWYGSVQEVTEDGGRKLVKISMRPHITSTTAIITSTNENFIEVYELRGGIFQYLRGEAPPEGITFISGS